MAIFEYKVVPAPKRGVKQRGVKTTEDRFAYALQETMNTFGADGWEYLRTDTLPCEERVGLTGRRTEFQNMLVFRRTVETAISVAVPAVANISAPVAPLMTTPPPVPNAASSRIEPVLAKPDPRVGETLAMDRDPKAAEALSAAAKTSNDSQVAAE